jgi:DNA polymerase elongation subunit (family B)
LSQKEYYTHVSQSYGKILYRGYKIDDSGKRIRVHGKLPYKPTLYVESQEKLDNPFKSLLNPDLTLKEMRFESIPEAREFVKKFTGVMKIHGYAPNRFEYDFIAQAFPTVSEVLLEDLQAIGFDIETKVGVNGPSGVPDPYLALEEITHIAFQNHKTEKVTSYTTAKISMRNEDGVEYTVFKKEEDLLEAIICYIEREDPDIIYGFYSDGFDMPYIVNRIRNVLGVKALNRLSPFGEVKEREYEVNGKIITEYTIVGRTHFDTQAMYKKFVLTKREKYSLDALAKIELGVGKLENPCSTFKEFCESEEHIDLFARYNVIDTKRLTELDKKCGLLSLGVSLAYLMKANFSDVFSPVKYWECYIMSILRNENAFVEVVRQENHGTAIPGAYVEEPIPGFYDWVVSIDATALYPSIMKGLNLSPETFVGMMPDVNVQAMLDGKTYRDFEIDDEYTMAANGAMFHKKFTGIVPRLVDNVLVGRKIAKNEMLRLKQLYVDTKDEKYKKMSELQNVLQGALKVAANSLFGVFLQPGFMFYDPRIGEAITLTGQYIIMHVGDHCNKRFNEYFKTNGVKYTIYRDTDSCFFTLKNVVEKYWSGLPDLKIVDALDKLIESHLRKFIDEATDTIADSQNYYIKTIFFKRENICSGGFWLAKKKYALKVYDSEGVRYPDGDYKIMGIEVVRSSTPEIARISLKECVVKVIDKDIESLREVVRGAHEQFRTVPIGRIAFPRGANNLIEYSHEETIYKKGCPIAVRAALLYNHHIDRLGLQGLYEHIQEGDKIQFIYVKEPNHFRENIIAFSEELPKEFNLDKFIDRELQFEKVFMAPLNGILKAVGWKLEEESTLDDFFG